MIELQKTDAPAVKQMREIYKEAFPRKERFPFRLLLKRAKQGRADFWCLMESGKPIGMAYIMRADALAYLFYFAIRKNERGHGYGTEAIRELRNRYAGCRLFLAVETMNESADNSDQRVRRRDFYLRCGFAYIPYRIKEASVVFDVMSSDGTVTPDEYEHLTAAWLGRPLKWVIDMRLKRI